MKAEFRSQRGNRLGFMREHTIFKSDLQLQLLQLFTNAEAVRDAHNVAVINQQSYDDYAL